MTKIGARTARILGNNLEKVTEGHQTVVLLTEIPRMTEQAEHIHKIRNNTQVRLKEKDYL